MILLNDISHFTPLRHSANLLLSKSNRFSFSVQSAATMSSPAKKVLVPIANGSEPMEAVIIADVLTRSSVDLTMAAVGGQLKVSACHGIKLIADALVEDCATNKYDLIALPGGMPGAVNLKECAILESMMKNQAAEGKPFGAICASPAVSLGTWGLLKGLKATCYPSFMDQLRPNAIAVDSRVQKDGHVVTSQGPATTMEFALSLVELIGGKERAHEVSGPLLMRTDYGEEHTYKELNPMQWTCSDTPQILVPIANGSEEMEAVIIIDILRRANANVKVASVEESLEIKASRNVKIEADMLIDDALGYSHDLIVLPGGIGGAVSFTKCEKLVTLLKKQMESNRPYGAICASPALVFEPHGLLKGKKATCFPLLSDKLTDQSEIENRVLIDGNLITSRGPGTAIEFALAIVEKLYGRDKALQLAKALLYA